MVQLEYGRETRGWGDGEKILIINSLAIPNSQFSISNAQCPITNYQLPIPNQKSKIQNRNG